MREVSGERRGCKHKHIHTRTRARTHTTIVPLGRSTRELREGDAVVILGLRGKCHFNGRLGHCANDHGADPVTGRLAIRVQPVTAEEQGGAQRSRDT